MEILELLAQGLPNKEIARTLGIASSTVKNQLTVVFERWASPIERRRPWRPERW